MALWTRQLAPLRRVAFDSNSLIYFVEHRAPYFGYVSRAVRMIQHGEALGIISTLVEMEMLVKPLQRGDARTLERTEILFRNLPNFSISPVTRTVAQEAARIRARVRLKLVDAVIAATALVDRCDAIIGNDAFFARHFTDIPYLYLGDYI